MNKVSCDFKKDYGILSYQGRHGCHWKRSGKKIAFKLVAFFSQPRKCRFNAQFW